MNVIILVTWRNDTIEFAKKWGRANPFANLIFAKTANEGDLLITKHYTNMHALVCETNIPGGEGVGGKKLAKTAKDYSKKIKTIALTDEKDSGSLYPFDVYFNEYTREKDVHRIMDEAVKSFG